MKTSLTDIDSYRSVCHRFLRDENAFAQFRSYSNDYNRVLEHVSHAKGQEYLNLALVACPDIVNNLHKISINDVVGKPIMYDYPGTRGQFSATTLRYTKVMADIYEMMGGYDTGDEIIEIGGGYGGQCRIIDTFMKPKRYTIIDLPVVLKLQEKYLNYFYPRVKMRFIAPDRVRKLKGEGFDLVISNFSFDELLLKYQKIYFNEILKKSRHGYISGRFDRDGHMGLEMFEDWANIREYIPDTGFNCHTITW